MQRKYSNQNHAVHRTNDVFEKIANIYDKQAISNRIQETKDLTFSNLVPSESEAVISTIKKEANELEEMGLMKSANVLSNPFEAFGHAKHYISSKLGLQSDAAHDLASSVVTKAQALQEDHGGEVQNMIRGIVDNFDKEEIQARVGALPMRKATVNEVEEDVKERLMQQFQMSAYQADQFKKIIVTQARNLLTQYRTHNLTQIAYAIISVLETNQDISLAYNISTSDRLRKEVEQALMNM